MISFIQWNFWKMACGILLMLWVYTVYGWINLKLQTPAIVVESAVVVKEINKWGPDRTVRRYTNYTYGFSLEGPVGKVSWDEADRQWVNSDGLLWRRKIEIRSGEITQIWVYSKKALRIPEDAVVVGPGQYRLVAENKDLYQWLKPLDGPAKEEIGVFEQSINFVYSPLDFVLEQEKDEFGGEDIMISSQSQPAYGLEINLNYGAGGGIGGGCPGFPGKDFALLKPILLDGQQVYKAQKIKTNSKTDLWSVGNIFLVSKDGEGLWNCPNVAGLESEKYGPTRIIYWLKDLYQSGMSLVDPSYIHAEANLDGVVKSLTGL